MSTANPGIRVPPPSSNAWFNALAQGVVLLAAVVLLLSAALKLGDLDTFAATLDSHGRITMSGAESSTMPRGLAIAVVTVEVAVGVLSLLPGVALRRTRGTQALGALPLICLWLALGAYALWMHLDPPPAPTSCGCGVLAGDGPADWRLIALRNFAVAGVLGLAWVVIDRAHPKPATFAS